MLPFEFIVEGPPVSQQTRNRARLQVWKQTVRDAAARTWPAEAEPTTDECEIRITYFYEAEAPDVDNIIKPIQDALNALVFRDDGQVVTTSSRKRRIDGSFRVRRMSRVLAEGFIIGTEFLYVRIVPVGDLEALE